MSNKYEEGIAFILEGDTEKEFYLSLLEFLCKKHGGILERQLDCGNSPDIIYSLRTPKRALMLKFNTVNTVTQMPHSNRWFITQCKMKSIKMWVRGLYFCVMIWTITKMISLNSMRAIGQICVHL